MEKLKKSLKSSFTLLFLFFLSLCLCACSFSFVDVEYSRAKKAQKKQQYKKAVKHFEKVIKRSPDTDKGLSSAKEAARLAFFQLRDPNKALRFYEHLMIYEKSGPGRRQALVEMADIYFDSLQDYKKAIYAFNKLLRLSNSPEEEVQFRYKLAKSHYRLGEFKQAEMETDAAMRRLEKGPMRFELELFKGNILFNTKREEASVEVYQSLLENYPLLAKEHSVAMSIVVAYEELEEFEKAIKLLNEMRTDYPDEEFLDLKITRLKDRKANLPGAKGLRK